MTSLVERTDLDFKISAALLQTKCQHESTWQTMKGNMRYETAYTRNSLLWPKCTYFWRKISKRSSFLKPWLFPTSPCLTPNLRDFLIFSGRYGHSTSNTGHISLGFSVTGSVGPGNMTQLELHKKNIMTVHPVWSVFDWADAQTGLSLCWAHTHFVGFVMLRLSVAFWYIRIMVVFLASKGSPFQNLFQNECWVEVLRSSQHY